MNLKKKEIFLEIKLRNKKEIKYKIFKEILIYMMTIVIYLINKTENIIYNI